MAALLALSGVAWLRTHRLAMPDMPSLLGGGMAMDAGSGAARAALFLAIWILMMVAMMLPALTPVLVVVERWRRGKRRSPATTLSFVSAYLGVWSGVGLLVLAVQETLPEPGDAARRIGGATLVAAGAYQLSPLKHACLRHCRSPLGFVTQHAGTLTRGVAGPFRVGAHHGLYCSACCWPLMLVLVLAGVMSPTWMALVAAVIFVEKVVPRGHVAARVVGVAMAVAGAAIAAA